MIPLVSEEFTGHMLDTKCPKEEDCWMATSLLADILPLPYKLFKISQVTREIELYETLLSIPIKHPALLPFRYHTFQMVCLSL